MNLIWISGDHPLQPGWKDLRQRVLRDPLGLRYSEEDIADEARDRSLLCIDEESLVGGLMVRDASPTASIWRVRQLAVDPGRQGSGIGRMLMAEVERLAREDGIRELILHSRENVVDFYRRLGFEVFGDPFEEVGIPHRKMRLGLE